MESGFLHNFPALSIPKSWKEICWLSHSWRLFILLPHLGKKSRKPTRSLEVLSHSKIKALWSDESLEIVFILHLALASFFLEALVKNYIWARFCHTAKIPTACVQVNELLCLFHLAVSRSFTSFRRRFRWRALPITQKIAIKIIQEKE